MADTAPWLREAQASRFPIQALPYGSIRWNDGRGVSLVVRIGDRVLDVAALADCGLFEVALGRIVRAGNLDPVLAAGPAAWRDLRARIAALLTGHQHRRRVEPHLHPIDSGTLQMPFTVADFVDFYSSLEHARNVGRIFRPDGEALPMNWRSLPSAYHGRSGTVAPSPTAVIRPQGQHSNGSAVVFGPTRQLDYELELGFVLGTASNLGSPLSEERVADHVFGLVLVNDWSARDVQRWEYQPLGPFLGKSFLTSISAWVLPFDAVSDARVPGPTQEPAPLPYLATTQPWALDFELTVEIRPRGDAVFHTVSNVNSAGLYWTIAQQLAHLTANGASVRPGDLIATGTISSSHAANVGCLLEATSGGTSPISIGDATRTFLDDGDTVRLSGHATINGVEVHLGDVEGTVVPGPGSRDDGALSR